MEWVQHKNPIRDDSDIYLCYMELGKSRVLRHTKPCFNGKYLLVSYIPDISPGPGQFNSHYKVHEIASYIGMPEAELHTLMIEKFNAVIETVTNYYPKERPTAEELLFKTVEDITAAGEWLLSISLLKKMNT